MEPLYQDFAEFVPHSYPRREVLWTKDRGVDLTKVSYAVPDDANVFVDPIWEYNISGDFIRFGSNPDTRFRYLVHAGNHVERSKVRKNYPEESWADVVAGLPGDVACIGSKNDLHIEGTVDQRGVPIDELMNLMAGCKVVVGGSSGPMHLAAFCDASIVVWGPRVAAFEPLEKRYKKAWNPFGVRVEYIVADDWRPRPIEVLEAVERVLQEASR